MKTAEESPPPRQSKTMGVGCEVEIWSIAGFTIGGRCNIILFYAPA